MRRLRQPLVLLGLGAIGLILAVGPVAAGGYDSTTEALIKGLNRKLVFIAVPITVLVEGVLVYTVWRFRNNDDPKPTTEKRWLEISWTVATALILLLVGAVSYQVMAHPAVTTTADVAENPPPESVEITIVGHQWFWEAQYPEANVTVKNAETIYVPANRTVYITVTSADVIHAVHVPELGLKQDAMPGQKTYLRTNATRRGSYQLYCAEYCGGGHSKMTATIEVVSYEEYQTRLDRYENSES